MALPTVKVKRINFRGGFEELRHVSYQDYVFKFYDRNRGVPHPRTKVNMEYESHWRELFPEWTPPKGKGRGAWNDYKKQTVLENGILRKDVYEGKEALWAAVKMKYPEVDISENVVSTTSEDYGDLNPDLTNFLEEAQETDEEETDSENEEKPKTSFLEELLHALPASMHAEVMEDWRKSQEKVQKKVGAATGKRAREEEEEEDRVGGGEQEPLEPVYKNKKQRRQEASVAHARAHELELPIRSTEA